MTYKPQEFYFCIHYDEELGGYYSVFARIEGKESIHSEFDIIPITVLPDGFYPLSLIENLFGFSTKPEEARKILSSKGFVENLDLI